MCLADDDFDELHPLTVKTMKVSHRVHAAASDRARVADEMEEHRLPAQVSEPYLGAVGGRQLEVRRLDPWCQSLAEQLRRHVTHPEVAEVEVFDRVTYLDESCSPPLPAVGEGWRACGLVESTCVTRSHGVDRHDVCLLARESTLIVAGTRARARGQGPRLNGSPRLCSLDPLGAETADCDQGPPATKRSCVRSMAVTS